MKTILLSFLALFCACIAGELLMLAALNGDWLKPILAAAVACCFQCGAVAAVRTDREARHV